MNQDSKWTPDQIAQARWMAEAGPQWMLARTVPIYAQARGGYPVLHGTGVLIKIADSALLVSAAHVFYDAMDDRTLLIGVAPRVRLLGLHGLAVHVSMDRDDEDVGFMRLPPAIAEEVAAHKQFVRLDQIDTERRLPEPGWYTVIGYPRSQSVAHADSRTIESEPFGVHTFLNEAELTSFTNGVSIAVAFTSRGLVDDTGQSVRAPAVRGISGCGIWRTVGLPSASRPTDWNLDAIRLAGIEHSTVADKAIKGVLAFRMIDAIRRNHPDLAPAIDLVRR